MPGLNQILGHRHLVLGLVLASVALIGVGCWLDLSIDRGASLGGAR